MFIARIWTVLPEFLAFCPNIFETGGCRPHRPHGSYAYEYTINCTVYGVKRSICLKSMSIQHRFCKKNFCVKITVFYV